MFYKSVIVLIQMMRRNPYINRILTGFDRKGSSDRRGSSNIHDTPTTHSKKPLNVKNMRSSIDTRI